MAIGDIARVSVLYSDSVTLSQYVNTFGFKAATGTATLANLATAFKTALVKNASGGLLYLSVNEVSSNQLIVRDVKPGTGAPYVHTYTAVTGANTSDMLPPQTAAVLSWRTASAGRSYRGRTYIPGIGEDQQNAGTWSAGALTALETIVTQMLAVFGSGGSNGDWEFHIISLVTGGAPRVTPIATLVTNGHADPIVYSQVRRTVGRGA